MHLEQEVALSSITRKIRLFSKHDHVISNEYQMISDVPSISGAAPNVFACWAPLVLNTCRIGKWANRAGPKYCVLTSDQPNLRMKGRDYFNMAGTNKIWTYMKWLELITYRGKSLHSRSGLFVAQLCAGWGLLCINPADPACTTRWVSWSRELESLCHLGERPMEMRSMHRSYFIDTIL